MIETQRSGVLATTADPPTAVRPSAPVTSAQLVQLVEQALGIVREGERADLRKRLDQTLARLKDPSIRVIVVGEFKQGKSKLINALVNAPVCPVDDDIATSVPTVVRHGDPASA